MTSTCYASFMETPAKRVTVYFDAALHRALRLKAAETDRSVSDLVNEAVRASLAEDASDLLAIEERRGEPELSFEAVVKNMRRRGQL
jgi:plasmid stability protein